jgi:hypothetical protein
VDWIKAITELITSLGHVAWPVLVGLIVWWFRKEIRREIAALIARISKVKGPGFEIDTPRLLSEIEAEIPEAIKQVKVATSASVTVRLVEGVNLLMERATTDPRNAIKRSWELLGGAVLRRANVSGENVHPDSEEISAGLKRLEGDTSLPEALIRSIRNLQQIARKVFYQSQFAFDPSPKEAQEYVLYSAAARKELGDNVQ